MHSEINVDSARQRYLDLIHRYLQGRVEYAIFSRFLRAHWAEERDELWHHAWHASSPLRRLEREPMSSGELPRSEPCDARRLPRMLDRLWLLYFDGHKEESFRNAVGELLAAYRCPGILSPEVKFVDYPPRIAVFERALPDHGDHWYPCTVGDIRAQLALLPEYDIRGIWAVGLAPPCREPCSAYGVYSRWHQPKRLPVVFIYSRQGEWDFKMRHRDDPGSIEHRYRMERSYGMQIGRNGNAMVCRWSAENGRRFILEYILPHAVGRHVQYEQRWRSGAKTWLSARVQKQFADAYAARFSRERRE